jgi:hypothetical protein
MIGDESVATFFASCFFEKKCNVSIPLCNQTILQIGKKIHASIFIKLEEYEWKNYASHALVASYFLFDGGCGYRWLVWPVATRAWARLVSIWHLLIGWAWVALQQKRKQSGGHDGC